jgi:hypothetical protein
MITLLGVVLGAIGIGGGIYETLLVDAVWPKNLAIVQPSRGGIDRKLFWAPVQISYEVVLLLSAWLLWRSGAPVRPWIVLSLLAHFSARTWSFAYFIPKALQFERLGELTLEQYRRAQRWTRLSRYRPLLEAVAVLALCAALLTVGTY